jgi:hypothetical protein
MRIKMNITLITAQTPLTRGSEYDLPEDQAREYVAKGLAVPVTSGTPARETATAKEVKETRTTPKPTGRKK